MDHYKTNGRGRQGETVIHDGYRPSLARTTIESSKGSVINFRKHSEQSKNGRAKASRLDRIKRSRKNRGLSARQLWQRKQSRRAVQPRVGQADDAHCRRCDSERRRLIRFVTPDNRLYYLCDECVAREDKREMRFSPTWKRSRRPSNQPTVAQKNPVSIKEQ